MQVAPLVAGEVLPQPGEPVVVSEQPTQHFSPELGLGTVVNATDVVDALTVGGLLDLGPTSTYYVGADGSETPVCADDPVVDVVGVDRKLFDAANAAKARTHFCWGMPGSLEGGSVDVTGTDRPLSAVPLCCVHVAENLCCVPPLPCAPYVNVLILLCCTCSILGNTLCCRHKDMAFPPWAGAALVITDKGVIGRRHFGPDDSAGSCRPSFDKQGLNAITWSGFDVDRNVRIRPYDAPRCTSSCDPISNSWDPLVCGLYFGLLLPCCRCICIQPNEPGLYRATIFSKHATPVSSPYGSIDLLALARSPDDLRSSLRALKERYLDSLPTTTVVHDYGAGCPGIDYLRSDTGRAEISAVYGGDSHGIQVGDTILKLDGQRVDHDAFNAGLAAARRAKRTVRLLIARGG